MADNTRLNSNDTTGDLIATDDIASGVASGAKVQRVKVGHGADGSYSDANSSTPLPCVVTNAGTFVTQIDGTALTRLTDIETNTDFGAVVGGGVEASALRVTLASDSTGVLGVTNAGLTELAAAINSSQLDINIASDSVGIGGGTQYTEDAAAAANPVGNAQILVRADTPAGVASTDGDNVAQRGTDYGAAYVQLVTSSGSFIDSVGGGTQYTEGDTDATITGTAILWEDSGNALATVSSGNPLPVGGTVSVSGTVTVDGSGVTQPVSGTVTANLSATDNAVLDNIDTNTSKGASHYRNIDANAEAEIKGSAGTLHWVHAINLTAAVAYLHLYDATAASVTPGSTTPNYTFPIPTQGDTNGAGFTLRLEQAFANGITLVCTTTTDGSTGDPGTNGVMVNAGYS